MSKSCLVHVWYPDIVTYIFLLCMSTLPVILYVCGETAHVMRALSTIVFFRIAGKYVRVNPEPAAG